MLFGRAFGERRNPLQRQRVAIRRRRLASGICSNCDVSLRTLAAKRTVTSTELPDGGNQVTTASPATSARDTMPIVAGVAPSPRRLAAMLGLYHQRWPGCPGCCRCRPHR